MAVLNAPMRSQPQAFIRLNRSNPLTRGLIAAYVPRSGPRDATGALATLVDASPVASPLGYVTPSLSSGPYPVVGTFPFTRTDPISAFVLGRFAASNDANGAPVVSVGQTGGSNGWKFGPFGSGGNLILTFISVADYSTSVQFPAIGSVAFSATPGANARIFTNGAFRQQLGIGTPNNTLPTARMAIGQRGDANVDSTSASQVALALYWNRALSDAEQASLAANPWQIFDAGSISRAYQAAIVAGAPTTTTISASIAWAEAGDVATIAGLLTNRVAAIWSEAGDTSALSAVITNGAASSWTEGDESAAAVGIVTDRGALTWTEQGDSVALTGSAASPAPAGFTAALSWTEAGESASIVARLTNRAALAITEQGDAWALTAFAAQPPVVTATVRFDPLPRNHGLKTVHFSN